MTKEEIILDVGKPLLRPIGIGQGIFIISFFLSPFIWIWFGWNMAWKIGLTGLIGTILLYGIYKIAKKIVTESVNENLDKLKDGKPKGKFQEKLDQMQKEYKQNV